jgi:WD40 repeat protein
LWKGEVKVWDVATFQERLSLPLEQWANGVAFSPDGKSLAVACGRYKDTEFIKCRIRRFRHGVRVIP